MSIDTFLWTEEFRPKTVNDLILPEYLINKFKSGEITNYLFYGNPGVGKTSAAKVLVQEFGYPYIYINASKDTSVDIVRSRITDFCSTRSIIDNPNKLKIVILDEIDGASNQFFKAFKASMEEFHRNARFIATSNYINKIDEATLSRFEKISFDFDTEYEEELIRKFTLRAATIAKNKNLNITGKALYTLVQRKFPDFRSTINSLQSFKRDNIDLVKIEHVLQFNSIFDDVFNLIMDNSNPIENYKFIMSNYNNKSDDVLSALSTEFVDFINEKYPQKSTLIPQIIVKVCYYQSIRKNVIDSNVSMLACIFELQSILQNIK